MGRDTAQTGTGTGALWIAVTVGLVPLVIAPHLLFHYDVTPKIIIAAVAVGFLFLRPGKLGAAFSELWSRRMGRWFCGLAGVQVAWFAVASATSARPWFSLLGTNWRRMGLMAILALAVFAALAAAEFIRSREASIMALRAFTLAAIAASLYGIFEYFDIDPLQTPDLYHAHAGDSVIVRPPGTLGHADYFAWWLAIAVFATFALARVSKGGWRWTAQVATVLAGLAILASGTRSAMLGVVAGFLFLGMSRSLRIGIRHAVAGTVVIAALAVFYFSPGGTRLRARTDWALTEPAGGARPLLWKDSLRMAMAHPLTGFGPETFAAEFPRYQSAALARLLPDFYYESPHDSALDVLVEQGLPGLVVALAWVALGFAAFVAANRAKDWLAAPLAAGLAASCTCAIFSAMTFTPVFATAILIAMLVSLSPAGQLAPVRLNLRWWLALSFALAALMIVFAGGLGFSEYRLARFQTADSQDAMALWPAAERAELPGAGEDLFASRKLTGVCRSISLPVQKITCGSLAAEAARRATASADNPPNAWYSFGIFAAAQNDAVGVESALRTAESLAPNWFKPHWTLANLLVLEHRTDEAQQEASRAAILDAGKDSEVLETLRRFEHEGR